MVDEIDIKKVTQIAMDQAQDANLPIIFTKVVSVKKNEDGNWVVKLNVANRDFYTCVVDKVGKIIGWEKTKE
ncbi:MAG: hypothetical protein ACP5UL_05545 [Thermoplasmata archaeon]